MRTVIKGGTVVTASDTYRGGRADRGREDRRASAATSPATRRSTRAASTSSPAGSTCIRTWRCPSAAPSRRTTSSPATARRPSAARRRTSTSPSSRRARRCARRSISGQPRRSGKAAIDYGFHLAITDLPDSVMDEIAQCPEWGVTSLKLFMAYKGALMVDDATLFRAMEQAAAHGLLIMVHAENGDAIDILVDQALAAGHTRAEIPRADPPAGAGGRGDQPRHPAGGGGGRAALRRPCHQCGRARGDPRGARSGAGRSTARPARSTSSSPRTTSRGPASRARSGSARRRSASVPTRRRSGAASRTTHLQIISTDHCPFWYEGGKDGRQRRQGTGQGRLLEDPQRLPGIEDRMMVLYTHGVRGGRLLAQPLGRAVLHQPGQTLRHLPAEGRDRPRQRRRYRHLGPGRDAHPQRRRRSTSAPTTTSTRA